MRAVMVCATVTVLALCGFAQEGNKVRCLQYEPSEASITGVLVERTFPGPPNYENVRNGDKPEVELLVDLSSPICMLQSAKEPDLYPDRKDIKEVQLVIRPENRVQYSSLVGKNVAASGTLFGAHTGHHHTVVLLTVQNIRKIP